MSVRQKKMSWLHPFFSLLPCWIEGILAPHSGHRTWSGSTNTGSRSHLRTWSCGRCRRLARRPGGQSPLPPWPAGSPSPCSWTTAAGYLWKKSKQETDMSALACLNVDRVHHFCASQSGPTDQSADKTFFSYSSCG